MKSSIVPLDPTLSKGVTEYLVGEGLGRGLTAEEVRWKYFDEIFNSGRHRGFAWLKDGRVRGFIGCIPAIRATPAGDREMIWTCDWSVEDPLNNPGIGILLLSKVHKITEFTAGVGGSADTQSTVPRMRTRTVPTIATTLRRPLRLSSLLTHAEKKYRFLPRLSGTSLGNVLVPWKGRRKDLPPSMVSSGVDAIHLAPLFDRPGDGECRVRYDARHLSWLGRYPGAEFRSFVLRSGELVAAALLWREPREPARWRLAVRHSPGAADLLAGLLADVFHELRTRQAAVISTILSAHDTDALAALKQSGFIEVGDGYPLYISDLQGPAACASGFADMSYLDTDLAFSS